VKYHLNKKPTISYLFTCNARSINSHKTMLFSVSSSWHLWKVKIQTSKSNTTEVDTFKMWNVLSLWVIGLDAFCHVNIHKTKNQTSIVTKAVRLAIQFKRMIHKFLESLWEHTNINLSSARYRLSSTVSVIIWKCAWINLNGKSSGLTVRT